MASAPVTAKGIYRNGTIELSETLNLRDGTEVNATIEASSEQSRKEYIRSFWEDVKQQIAEEQPELLAMTREERIEDFERLSQKIAENLPYKTPEEFMQAMRGGGFDLARY